MKLNDPLPTLEDGLAAGRAAREGVPRGALAALGARPDDYDPVARLVWQGQRRVASLLPIRYQRMLESPFAFYRGAALLMAEDLARGVSSPFDVQLCGDAHVANFGVFSSPERQLVFDVNDFDETDPGPFEWDVKRLVASLAIAAEELRLSGAAQRTVAVEAAGEYQRSMRRFAMLPTLDVWYAQLDLSTMVRELRGFFTAASSRVADVVLHQAKTKQTRRRFEEMLTYADDGPHIRPLPPVRTTLSDVPDGSMISRGTLDEVVGAYGATLSGARRALLDQFTVVDAAHQIVGVGSVGTQCFIILLVGRDAQDPFFIQVKEAQQSVVSVARATASLASHGQRVVRGQQLMQATPDLFLGWHDMRVGGDDRSFYIRQLYDNKAVIAVNRLDGPRLAAYGRVCAWTLARAHARSGARAQIAGYLGSSDRFAEAVADFAMAYLERNAQDYSSLKRAAKEGRVTVAR